MFSPLLRPILGPSLPRRELCPDVPSSEQLAGPPQSWSDMQRYTVLRKSTLLDKLAVHIV